MKVIISQSMGRELFVPFFFAIAMIQVLVGCQILGCILPYIEH